MRARRAGILTRDAPHVLGGVLNCLLCSISQPQGRHSVADRCEFGAVALLIRQLFIVR